MTTQPHGTLNLKSDGVQKWLDKNNISININNGDNNDGINNNINITKQLPPEIQPKSNESNSNSTDTKQTIQPLYSHSRSRTYVKTSNY